MDNKTRIDAVVKGPDLLPFIDKDNTTPRIRLSLLDTAMVGNGKTTHEALEATLSLVRHAEKLGFTRYWMAEHHGFPGVASSAPAITIGALAAATSRILVGSGGVMLPNHVSLLVAEQFGTLAALYPGRIDLGVGRASPESKTAMVLSQSLARYGVDEFSKQVLQLSGFLKGNLSKDHPYNDVFVSPRAEEPPVIWILSTSAYGAELAGSLGFPFAFAHHFGRGNAAATLQHYRRAFRPSATLSEPYAIVTALVACAPTDEEADKIARSADLFFLRMMKGQPGKLPSPQEAADHSWTPENLAFIRQRRNGQAVGSPETVHTILKNLLETTGADELMMTTQMYAIEDRVRSIELVNELFNKVADELHPSGK